MLLWFFPERSPFTYIRRGHFYDAAAAAAAAVVVVVVEKESCSKREDSVVFVVIYCGFYWRLIGGVCMY